MEGHLCGAAPGFVYFVGGYVSRGQAPCLLYAAPQMRGYEIPSALCRGWFFKMRAGDARSEISDGVVGEI